MVRIIDRTRYSLNTFSLHINLFSLTLYFSTSRFFFLNHLKKQFWYRSLNKKKIFNITALMIKPRSWRVSIACFYIASIFLQRCQFQVARQRIDCRKSNQSRFIITS